MSYTTPSERRDVPEGAREAFPGVAWAGMTVSQEEGPVDMIIGRDNPEWMPVPMQEEPYERFTLMWTNPCGKGTPERRQGYEWMILQADLELWERDS